MVELNTRPRAKSRTDAQQDPAAGYPVLGHSIAAACKPLAGRSR
jgi:hypothetical protein